MSIDKTLEEVRRIKEECSMRFLSQTPEERRQENEEVRKRMESLLGKPMILVNSSRQREPAKQELAQV